MSDSSSQEHDPDQWWFWTPDWQNGEREADADITAGRTTFFASGEELEAYLDPTGNPATDAIGRVRRRSPPQDH